MHHESVDSASGWVQFEAATSALEVVTCFTDQRMNRECVHASSTLWHRASTGMTPRCNSTHHECSRVISSAMMKKPTLNLRTMAPTVNNAATLGRSRRGLTAVRWVLQPRYWNK